MSKFEPIPERVLALYDEVEQLLQTELFRIIFDELPAGTNLDLQSMFFGCASFRQLIIQHSKYVKELEEDGIVFGPLEEHGGEWGASYDTDDLIEAEEVQEAAGESDDFNQEVLVENNWEGGRIIPFPGPKKRVLH